ncbi:hypothetical protein [Streptomyces sp. NRRL F-2664]|uniref:hypothetical protein n=1 Tax=Streptomyces sp. NRRL F-2664 TaxID=1463842 RepID=UPI00131B2C72|nr:hypothetical protein [Streptomyces sp. NRRL F-2664]
MATRDPDPLAGVVSRTAAGERLVFLPSRLRESGVALGSSVLVPLCIAAPLLLAFLFVAVLTESAVAWALVRVVLGLAVLAVVGLAVGSLWVVAATQIRWIEFRPHEDTTRLVIAHFLRSSAIAVADLERVAVVERFRLGRRTSIKVVLQRRGGTLDCEPALRAPLSLVDRELLLDWLTGRLGPSRVGVEYRKEIDRTSPPPSEWWTQSDLAALWQVPAAAVDDIADRHAVRRHSYTPRAASTSTATVYDPTRAHEVADELRRARTLRPPRPAARRPLPACERGCSG